jgi:hypothetical protein
MSKFVPNHRVKKCHYPPVYAGNSFQKRTFDEI